jgi:hypothetical protein
VGGASSEEPRAGLATWLRTLIILVAIPPWLATIGVYLYHGEPPPAEILTIPLGLVAATSTPGVVAEIGRRVLRGGSQQPSPAPPPQGGQP